MLRNLCVAFGLGLMLLSTTAVRAGDDAEARKIAEKVTAEGAAIFDTFDAKAMAATYDEKAILINFEREGGAIVRQSAEGREKVKDFYAKVFENPETIKSKNTVDRARLLADDLLSIDGTLDTNSLKPDSFKIAFHQVRQKKDGKWLVLVMEISLVPKD